jgi:adenylate kinase family enzyme
VQRVLVTGNAGAGKTTLVRNLAAALDIPAYSMDSIVWQAGWKRTPPVETQALTEELVQREQWVIDAVSLAATAAADTIIFLDLPRRVVGWRAAKRTLRYLFRTRPEMPPGCVEVLVIPKLVRIIWRFPTTARPRIVAAIADRSDAPLVVHVSSTAAQRRLVAMVGAAAGAESVIEAIRSFAADRLPPRPLVGAASPKR